MLEAAFPEFVSGRGSAVVGENYPAGALAVAAATLLSVLQWGGILLMLGGERAFQWAGVAPPALIAAALQNKLVLLGVFFVAGQLAARLTATGAFEVYLDGALLHSKLESGRVPHVEDVVDALAAAGLPLHPEAL